MDSKTLKKGLRFALIAPLAIAWDILYTLICFIYKWSSYIDKIGGDKLDEFIHKD